MVPPPPGLPQPDNQALDPRHGDYRPALYGRACESQIRPPVPWSTSGAVCLPLGPPPSGLPSEDRAYSAGSGKSQRPGPPPLSRKRTRDQREPKRKVFSKDEATAARPGDKINLFPILHEMRVYRAGVPYTVSYYLHWERLQKHYTVLAYAKDFQWTALGYSRHAVVGKPHQWAFTMPRRRKGGPLGQQVLDMFERGFCPAERDPTEGSCFMIRPVLEPPMQTRAQLASTSGR